MVLVSRIRQVSVCPFNKYESEGLCGGGTRARTSIVLWDEETSDEF